MREAYFEKYRVYKLQSDILYKWMYSELENRTLDAHLSDCGYKNIAIYGMSVMGGLIYDKLKDSNIRIDCFIDANRKVKSYYLEEINVVKPGEVKDRKEIDLIIISLPHIAKEIEENLRELNVSAPIVSVEDLIMEL